MFRTARTVCEKETWRGGEGVRDGLGLLRIRLYPISGLHEAMQSGTQRQLRHERGGGACRKCTIMYPNMLITIRAGKTSAQIAPWPVLSTLYPS